MFVQYFDELFTTSEPRIERKLIDAVQPKVSDKMNALLNREFQASEVEKALKQMHPMMAPGPDGIPPLFYQHFWPIVRSIVVCTALNFLNHGIAPPNTKLILCSFQKQKIWKESGTTDQ